MKAILLLLALLSFNPLAFAQEQIKVDHDNKTIAVTAEEEVMAPPDIAVLTLGFHNYGLDKDSAFSTNLKSSNAIADALLKAGVARDAIETESLKLQESEPDQYWTPSMKAERRFEAAQSWKIRVAAKDAQAIVDIAVSAGANQIDSTDWQVSDRAALQAKAGAAALEKARKIAEQMAKGLSARLGDLLYASNRAPATPWSRLFGAGLNTMNAEISAKKDRKLQVQLFPQNVKETATVYAVFSVQ
jgi:uncharacterized protein YggE